jgi:cbb3-type cytochrome oxidase subunit 3
MSNSILFLISFVIFISSLSESFEFIVHNEESLLVLCFIAFIFFAYSFGSVEASDYIKKTAASLEDQLLLVVFSRFKALISNFNEFFFFRGLVIRFQFILALLLSRLRSD